MDSIVITVKKVEEAGYSSALLGLSLNKKRDVEDMINVSQKLAPVEHGHNKFLESMIVWLDVVAPRYFWQEADTFRLSTKQSESTMHTLVDELLNVDMNSDAAVEEYLQQNFEPDSCSVELLGKIRTAAEEKDLVMIKKLLPEGFVQRRLWCMSYKTLANIIIQRRTHRLPHWKEFVKQILDQVEHPELLPGLQRKK
jgi:hypothetical protein